MEEHMVNIGREIEILRKNQKKLEIKNTVTEIKNTFEGHSSKLDMAKEKVSDTENV